MMRPAKAFGAGSRCPGCQARARISVVHGFVKQLPPEVGVPAQRQPGPDAGLIPWHQQWSAGAGQRLGGRRDQPLEPGQPRAPRGRVGVPGDETDMVLTQPVAQFGFDCAKVDLPVLEQRPHPAGPHGGLGEQPAVAFVFVDGEDLFGDPVDVPGAELHHAACRGHDKRYLPALPAQLIETPLQESLVADPVGADQRTGGHATLGQPAGVLDRRRRRFDIIDRHSVLEDMTYRCDVLRDAGAEDAEDRGIPPQLLDLGREVLGHILGDLGQTTAEACCHGRK